MKRVWRYLRALIATALFAVLGVGVGYGLYCALMAIYPYGMRIDNWSIIIVLYFFSILIFFVWMMMIDILEIVCKPLRKLGGPYRIVGLAAIVAYIFFGGLCLWELWVNIYRFHFTTINDIDGKKFLMAIWLSLVTIGCYGICITSAWGPKDLGRRQSS